MNQVWTEAELNFIRANASLLKDEEMLVALRRFTERPVSLNALRKTRHRLGIKKKCGRGRCELDKLFPSAAVGLSIIAT